MDEHVLTVTRRSLHGVAELILAGPQYRRSGTIRLQVTDGGFGTVADPDARVAGDRFVQGETGAALDGLTYRAAAASVGLDVSPLDDVYHDGPGIDPDERTEIDANAAQYVCDVFAVGQAALVTFAPASHPVLWPEHFDLGISVDEVNYGVLPGDRASQRPYAYIGPWTPREGSFWNAPFGAMLPLDDDLDVDAIVAFMRRGREVAAGT